MIKLDNTTAKSVTAMAAAALLAGLAVLFAAIVPEARFLKVVTHSIATY